jgi:HSP20 family protein
MNSLMRAADQPVLSLREAMNRLFEQSFTPFTRSWATDSVYGEGIQHVPTNLWEDGEHYYLYLLVPGVDPASVDITATAGTLTISGKLTAPQPSEDAKAVWNEWGSAELRRSFQLPAGFDAERCHAAYKEGVLTLTVPKPEQIKPRSIKIQAAS